MPKIDVESLKHILQRNETDIRKINDIMHDIEMELQAEEEERANRPPPAPCRGPIAGSFPSCPAPSAPSPVVCGAAGPLAPTAEGAHGGDAQRA